MYVNIKTYIRTSAIANIAIATVCIYSGKSDKFVHSATSYYLGKDYGMYLTKSYILVP